MSRSSFCWVQMDMSKRYLIKTLFKHCCCTLERWLFNTISNERRIYNISAMHVQNCLWRMCASNCVYMWACVCVFICTCVCMCVYLIEWGLRIYIFSVHRICSNVYTCVQCLDCCNTSQNNVTYTLYNQFLKLLHIKSKTAFI